MSLSKELFFEDFHLKQNHNTAIKLCVDQSVAFHTVNVQEQSV